MTALIDNYRCTYEKGKKTICYLDNGKPVEKIEITSLPTKVDYIENDTFDGRVYPPYATFRIYKIWVEK